MYRLGGNGVLTVSDSVYLGYTGGLFDQSGGIHNIGTGTTSGGLLLGPLGAGTYLLSSGELHVSGGVGVGGSLLAPAGHGVLSVAGGTASVAGKMKVHWGGTVNFNGGELSVGTLDLGPDANMLLSPGGNKVLTAKALVIAGTGRIDLADNGMIIDHSGASPAATLRSYLQNGCVMSSTASSTDCALGYAEAASIFTSFPATFLGHDVDSTSLLVAYTRGGDANLDRLVNLQDFNRLAGSFVQTDRFWMQGDYNYDGIVNLTDFNRLAANFGLSAGPDGVVDPADWSALAAAVPEPAVTTVIGGLCATTLRRRHRRIRKEDTPLPSSVT